MNNQSVQKYVAQLLKVAVLGGCLALASAAANSAESKLTLVGANETPPVKTAATGTGSIVVNADKTVSGTIITTGMVGTVAHIHLAPEGKKGPPIIFLVKSGESGWSVPAGSRLTDEQYASYKAGDLYVNVHTAENKDGEIRAQLKP